MFKKIEPDRTLIRATIRQFPHCDSRVLHAPGECEFCDQCGLWQALRMAWGIAFTNYEPDDDKKELPDPATYARGAVVNWWPGNRASKDPCKI